MNVRGTGTVARRLIGAAGVAGLGLVMALAPAASAATVSSSGALRDLQPSVSNPTDGASAKFRAVPDGAGGSRAVLIVTGLQGSTGTTLGAHVHIGPCVAGSPAAALGHYNTGGPASPTSEVWLDFTIRPGGVGVSQASVPFTVVSATRSVVIHELATSPTGGAGGRMACLPVQF